MQPVRHLLHLAAQQQLQHPDSVPVVDLSLASPRPLLPTLNGLLLGYPVVWLVPDPASVERAAAWLSAVPLRLYRITAKYLGTEVRHCACITSADKVGPAAILLLTELAHGSACLPCELR